jgi:SnoaL-like domain
MEYPMTHLEPAPITGAETEAIKTSCRFALIEFYQAFNTGNLALMQENWLPSPEASMANPLGGLLRGWDTIYSVYARIFNGPAQVYVEFYDYHLHEGDGYFLAVGRERGRFCRDELTLELAIRTSRTFVLSKGHYRQLHHHGSIENPDLLARYQAALSR